MDKSNLKIKKNFIRNKMSNLRKGLEAEQKINELIGEMTIAEKTSMCHAKTKFSVNGIERLGIPDLTMSDGPHGVREEMAEDSWSPAGWDNDACTYQPTGTALAATWNRERADDFGHVLGAEARFRKKDIILGPGINIVRTPLCGRNFEYYGEDPYQISQMVIPAIKAIQQEDVAADAKHYALNNQELNRNETNVEVDERPLREIYLRGFEAAVKDGDVLTLMGSYNLIRGEHGCHNEYLINKILKEEWGFQGFVVSDWNGTYGTTEAALYGLDIEMGTEKSSYDEYYLGKPFQKKIEDGEILESVVDDKVRRILRVMFAIGIFDENRKPGSMNTTEHQATALRAAEEAIVLLKNEKKILPINKNKVKKIAVIGENAITKHAHGGASSGLKALYEISPLEGIQNYLKDSDIEIIFAQGYPESSLNMSLIGADTMATVELGSGVKGWNALYKDYPRTWGKEVFNKTESYIDFTFDDGNIPSQITNDSFCIEWTGKIIAPETGKYTLGINSDHRMTVRINSEKILEMVAEGSLKTETVEFDFIKGNEYDVKVVGEELVKGSIVKFGWAEPGQDIFGNAKKIEEAVNATVDADIVLFFGGLNHQYDTEGGDRTDMKLHAGQNELINQLLDVNKNLVFFNTSGCPVEMPWIDKVPAIVQNWYGGMEIGTALANIIFGDVNPSGKLPFTFPIKLEDCPAHNNIGTYKFAESVYTEGLFVGYRYYDTNNIPVLFPFGHGLSYTSFEYSNLTILKNGNTSAIVSFDITNTGNIFGAEITQLYVEDVECSFERPLKELKGFEKVFLKPNETQKVTMNLTEKELNFYNDKIIDWVVEPGLFKVHIGTSVNDISLIGEFEV
jgi:beta-glucosidase